MSKSDDNPASKTSTHRCVICGNPRSEQYRPFCSKRCADVDLGRWLKGDYAIPVMADDDEDGEAMTPLQSERPDDFEGGESV